MTAAAAPPLQPFGPAGFAARLRPLLDRAGLPPAAPLAIAVSGGPDSLALADLALGWGCAQGAPIHLLTVDHALRPESAAEAASIPYRLGRLDVAAHVLRWQPERPPAARIQETARAARRALLVEAAQAAGAGALLLAHHADDQAETLLMRLAHGSGLKGLAAMHPLAWTATGLPLLRPLLDLPKQALIQHCRARGLAFVEDPSNRAGSRGRLRGVEAALAAEGLTGARLAQVAGKLRRADAAVEAMVAALWGKAVVPGPPFTLARSALVAAPDEVALRLLARALRQVVPAPYPPREGVVLAALARLRAGGGALTAGGCLVKPSRIDPDRLILTPAPPRRGGGG